jgi:glycosyltransferase 2 family protein
MATVDRATDTERLLESDARATLKVSWPMLLIGLFLLTGLVIYVIVHVGEMERFAVLLSRAKPKWLVVAFVLQAATYVCAGAVWHEVTRPHTGRLPVGALVRLSIEQLSINQIVPTGGVSGGFVVFKAMRRLGLPRWLATEALVAGILSGYIAYAVVAILAFTLLWLMGRVTIVLCYLLAAFVLSVLVIVAAIVWLLMRKNRPLPKWLGRFKPVLQLYETARHASADRILGRRLLTVTTAINVVIFLLDGATLWAMMHVAGAPIGIPSAFVAIVIGFVAGAVSFLPGGIGSFEAGCVATLALLGSPFEAALAGTLLFRGLTLWIPLLPGLVLARQDVKITV